MILRLPRDAPKTQRYAPAVTPLKLRATCHVLRGWSKRYAPRPRSGVTLAYNVYMPAGLFQTYGKLRFLFWVRQLKGRLVDLAGEAHSDDEDLLYIIYYLVLLYIYTQYYFNISIAESIFGLVRIIPSMNHKYSQWI